MKTILMIMLAGIGDSLLVTPTLRALKQTFPEAKISALVMYPAVKEMLERNKDVDEVLFFDFLKEGYLKSLRFALQMRKKNFDVSFLAYPANRMRHNLISFLIGAKQRFGHRYDIKRLTSLSFLHTKRIRIDSSRHAIDENLELLPFVGIEQKNFSHEFVFSITPEEKKFAEQFFLTHNITKKDLVIGMHPGSSELAGMMLKRWPKEKFALVADWLAEKHHAKILIFGGKNEMQLKQDIVRMMKQKPILVDDVTFFQSAALIKKCSLFLCNDTGLMHLAAFFKVPIVVLTGHCNPEKTKPLHAATRVITPDIVCRLYRIGEDLTCLHEGTPQYCLNRIKAEDVYRAAEELLP